MPDPTMRTAPSSRLGKNVFHCFHAQCAAEGKVLDWWTAVHRLLIFFAPWAASTLCQDSALCPVIR